MIFSSVHVTLIFGVIFIRLQVTTTVLAAAIVNIARVQDAIHP